MPRTTSRRLVAATAATLGLLGGSTLIGTTGAGAALPASASFTYTGSVQDYVVPDAVCAVTITAAGAQGGAGSSQDSEPGGPRSDATRLPGGLGATATAEITVVPGESLRVYVGGAGGDGDWAENTDEGGAGGWNGGGAGGAGGENGGGGGGGGGGASDVRQGGSTLTDRVVVAGGGGGSGAYASPDSPPVAIGGVGGNPATDGGDGQSIPTETFQGQVAIGGGGATTTAGGVGGQGGFIIEDTGEPSGDPTPYPGADGTEGLGGAGGTAPAERAGGGGGGGGLHGGGGGGAAGWSEGAGGGGGSSLGESTTPGVHEGDGAVTITPSVECTTPPDSTTPDSSVAPTTVAMRPAGTTPVQPTLGSAPVARPVAAQPAYTG